MCGLVRFMEVIIVSGSSKVLENFMPTAGPCSLASGEGRERLFSVSEYGFIMGIKIESFPCSAFSYAILFFKGVFFTKEKVSSSEIPLC